MNFCISFVKGVINKKECHEMTQHFIVANTFTHQIDCFCPDKEHGDFFRFKGGDVIEITNDWKVTIGNG